MSIKYLLQNMVYDAHDYGEVYRYDYPFDKSVRFFVD